MHLTYKVYVALGMSRLYSLSLKARCEQNGSLYCAGQSVIDGILRES